MVEKSDSGDGNSSGDGDKPRENCHFCGGSESERWHFIGGEQTALVCNICYDLKEVPQRSSSAGSGSSGG